MQEANHRLFDLLTARSGTFHFQRSRMGVEAYWIRLDVDYDRVWWLRKEPRFVRDAWPNLIRYVRRESPRKGTVKFRDVEDLADACRYSPEEAWAFARMLECAQMTCDSDPVPAVTIAGGVLTVVKWGDFQGADAVRKRLEARNNSGDNTVTPELLNKSGLNQVTPEKPVTRDTGTREHGNTGTDNSKIPDGTDVRLNVFDEVEKALLDTPQFSIVGINSKLMGNAISHYLTMMEPQDILKEAFEAQTWLKGKPPDSHCNAPAFFRKWLKRAEVNIRRRNVTFGKTTNSKAKDKSAIDAAWKD
jgi:hypothetical protein